MKVAILPDSFKGSLSSKEVASAISEGIKKFDNSIEIETASLADGGEGTVSALVEAKNGSIVEVEVLDPLNRQITAAYGIIDSNVAVIEVAAASGLPLLTHKERNPLKASSYGTGQIILDALDKGCKKIIVGLGGSATNDGGIGMLNALGVKFYDKKRKKISLDYKGLLKLNYIDLSELDQRLKETEIIVASDVQNVLCGKEGASYIYGPQKGATQKMVKMLDKALMNYAEVIKKQFDIDLNSIPYTGAAGGFGAAFIGLLNGKPFNGIDLILEICELENNIRNADLVITGEGRIDNQTIYGKTPVGVSKLCMKHGVPVVAIVGSIGSEHDKLYDYGIDAIFSIQNGPMSFEQSEENSEKLLKEIAFNVIGLFASKNKTRGEKI